MHYFSTHISDRSSTVGVCASCLRDRLFVLIAEQSKLRSQFLLSEEQDRRNSDPIPPPLIFPRSVSPYICRRNDDSSRHLHRQLSDHRFFSTPQVVPTFSSSSAVETSTTTIKKKKKSKFNLLANLFRFTTRLKKRDNHQTPDPSVSSISRANLSASTSNSSPISSTWFSSFNHGNQKHNKQSQLQSSSNSSIHHHNRRSCRARDRGMSPSCEEEEDQESPIGISDYLSETSPGLRKSTTAPPVSRRRGQSPHSRHVSGMAFCLSPLVRASPNNNHRNQKDIPVGISGEIGRVSNNKPNLSTAASFCANRSRKLTHFGRHNYNS